MTEQEIYKKIEDTYNSEKGKGFITHLLRSFFPVGKGEYAWSREEGVNYKCCITGVELGTKDDMFKTLMSEENQKVYMDDFMEGVRAMAKEDSYTHSEEFMGLKDKVKPLAVVAEKSNKCLSQEAYQQLQNFYVNELFRDNKHINWIVNNERAKQFVDHGKKDGIIQTKREERVVHKAAEHSGMTLGDIDVLRNLKERLEQKEKK